MSAISFFSVWVSFVPPGAKLTQQGGQIHSEKHSLLGDEQKVCGAGREIVPATNESSSQKFTAKHEDTYKHIVFHATETPEFTQFQTSPQKGSPWSP